MLITHSVATRARAVGILFALGLAASAYGQGATSRLHYEVRPQGAPSSAWTTDLTVAPGTIVEFRALVTYTGTLPAVGLLSATFQPTVSHWNAATDALQPFRQFGLGTLLSPLGPQSGSVARDSGEYGRIAPYGSAGISTNNALRGHTNNVVDGVRYLRIAQNNTSNWVGVGPTEGAAAANNFNGAGGIPVGQTPPRLAGSPNINFVAETANVEVARFAIRVDGVDARVLEISTPAAGILRDSLTNLRQFSWARTLQSEATDVVRGAVTVESAIIRVPTPGVVALLGFGGVMAARRRR